MILRECCYLPPTKLRCIAKDQAGAQLLSKFAGRSRLIRDGANEFASRWRTGRVLERVMVERIRVNVTPSEHVTAIVYSAAVRDHADIFLILAHGAGGNQTSAFMVHFATALAARGIDTVTFNFVYSEEGRRVPDRNDKLEACWRKVIEAFHRGVFCQRPDRRKLVIGGKSMGGRIAAQVAGANGDDIAGLLFLGYPLHPPSRPDKLRTKRLPDIHAPMLFVQGSRDAFGAPDELAPIIRNLTPPADLCIVDGGDHSFKVPKKAAASQEQVYNFAIDEIERWLRNARI